MSNKRGLLLLIGSVGIATVLAIGGAVRMLQPTTGDGGWAAGVGWFGWLWTGLVVAASVVVIYGLLSDSEAADDMAKSRG